MTIHLIASSNLAYANRITGWLDAATAYGPPDLAVTLAAVVEDGGEPWADALARDYPGARVLPVGRGALAFAPPLDHLQAGGFLPALRPADDDVIVFTDGDAYLQRPLTADERGMLADWPADVVGLAYNAGPDDTLATEGQRLRPQADPADRGFDTALPVYNLGVIVCRAAAYRRWHDAYATLRPRLEGLFKHHAHQQWGLCAALPAAGLRAAVLPPSVHIHGHYPPPPGVSVARERGRVTANGAVVLFRHYL